MNYRVSVTPDFEKMVKRLAKKYRSLPQDLSALVESLEEDAHQGVLVYGNVRKVRLAVKSKGRGKSGGARVLTYLIHLTKEIELKGELSLIAVYDKSSISTLEDQEIIELLKRAHLI